MSIENIVKFLQERYSDEQLAALLAHAQDGKLSYRSCCCLIGFPSANHAAVGYNLISMCPTRNHFPHGEYHKVNSLESIASHEFCELGFDHERSDCDDLRREKIIPIILAEMERRELAEQYRAEEEAAAEEGAEIEASGYPDPQHESNGRY